MLIIVGKIQKGVSFYSFYPPCVSPSVDKLSLRHVLMEISKARNSPTVSVCRTIEHSGDQSYRNFCLTQVFRKDSHFATLRADKRALYVQKSFPINIFDKLTARLQTTGAVTYDGPNPQTKIIFLIIFSRSATIISFEPGSSAFLPFTYHIVSGPSEHLK